MHASASAFFEGFASRVCVYSSPRESEFFSLCLSRSLGDLSRNPSRVIERMSNIYYSSKYYDDKYEYRHVVLPKEMVKLVPRTHLLSEQEWRAIGVQQSQGWVHYMIHEPEPHILLFKRKITTPPELREEEN